MPEIRGVLITGMHRSGTSAMTRVLNLLGCALPEDLIPPNVGNELGHWESTSVVGLNDQILAEAGSRWDDWATINPDWHSSSLRDQAVTKATGIIGDHANLGLLFAIKDPRICRLLDVWLEAMDAAKVQPSVVILLRNPAEVAASLQRRDLMDPAYAHLLWLRHMLDAEYKSRGRNRIFCSFDQFINSWPAAVNRIKAVTGVSFPRNSATIQDEIDQFLVAENRHHSVNPESVLENTSLSQWLRRTYAILARWTDLGESAEDYPELDRIRQEFDFAAPAFARLILPGSRSEEAGAGGHIKSQLEQARQTADEMARLVQEAATREDELMRQVAERAGAAAQLESELQALRDWQEQQARASNEAQLHAAALADQIAKMQSELETAQGRLTDQSLERNEFEAQLEAVRQALAQAEARATETTDRLAVAESALAQRQEELVQVWADLEAARAGLIETARLQEELAKHKTQLAEANDWVFRLAGERQAAVSEAKATGSALARETKARRLAEVQLEVIALQLANVRAELQAVKHLANQQAPTPSLPPPAIEEETEQYGDLQPKDELSQSRILQLTELLQERDEAVGEAEAARSVAERRLAERFAEIATLTKMLRQGAADSDRSLMQVQWLRQVNAVANGIPSWWAIMPTAWRRKREHSRYARHGLFNADKYLELYPDVAESGMDPLRHYILHGLDENRKNPI